MFWTTAKNKTAVKNADFFASFFYFLRLHNESFNF